MNCKKLLSVILSLTMFIGIVPLTDLDITASAEETEVTAYVDGANGNDETGKIGDNSLPYATIAAAVAAIDALSGNYNRIVHLSAEGYTVIANAIYKRGQSLGYWE